MTVSYTHLDVYKRQIVHSTDDYLYVCNMKTGVFQYTSALIDEFDLPGEVIESPIGYWRKIVHPDDWN